MSYEMFIGYVIQGLFTGGGVAIGTWFFKKYLEPTLEKNHERLASIPIPPLVPQKPIEDKGFTVNDRRSYQEITEPPGYRTQHASHITGTYVDNSHTVKPQQVGMPKW